MIINDLLWLRFKRPECPPLGSPRIRPSGSSSSVHRILICHGLKRLPANQKHRPRGQPWLRYEKPQPRHRPQRVDSSWFPSAESNRYGASRVMTIGIVKPDTGRDPIEAVRLGSAIQ